MRVNRIVATACVVALAAASAPTALAQPQRSVTEGVYTADQAARGGQVYREQCASCHGDALEGLVGPPLVGDGFLSIWSARPVVELVDKIHNTMPLEAAEPLSREQSIDLTAYILQAGGFPAGQAALADATVAEIALPAGPGAAASAGGGDVPLAPLANLAQLMRAIAFPASNIVFNVQIKNPADDVPPPTAARSFDFVEWGSTVYPGWEAIDLAALALAESAPLFLVPGRRCENGRPVPVERADWQQYTGAVVEAGRAAYRASQSRDWDAAIAVTDQLNEACDNCHKVYRDAGSEGRGQGADRCRQDP
ncbi:MAG: cytochrome c [Acidobacteria bacterium]|nr:cytochrome c [Acidobacteriota bacterium]